MTCLSTLLFSLMCCPENSKAGEQCLWSAGQYYKINAQEKYTHGKVENPYRYLGVRGDE